MKYYFTFVILLIENLIFSQSYAPAAGIAGSTAIESSSSLFVDWASGCTTARGLQNIMDVGGLYTTIGNNESAIGPADGFPISLGDRGMAVVTFLNPITNGDGFDFAVFENSFSDSFLELAFVEVSSDGIHFFRFPSHSETQMVSQIDGFGSIDCRFINNLAGKYRVSFGTPFDLSDMPEDILLDKNRITHIKIIDVVGSIDPDFASYDGFGNIINDPFPTSFPSSGFDLDAVGVIHQTLGLGDLPNKMNAKLYPIPAKQNVFLELEFAAKLEVYDVTGKKIHNENMLEGVNSIDVSKLKNGIYFFKLNSDSLTTVLKIVIQ